MDAILGVELGSTRIKAVLTDADGAVLDFAAKNKIFRL